MLQFLRTNPGVFISVALLGACGIVGCLVGLLMTRGGASPRPVYWLAGFFTLVILPQIVGSLWMAIQAGNAAAPRNLALDQLAAPAHGEADAGVRQAAVKLLFGPDADAQLIIDARQVFGDAFEQAESAPFATLPNGDTVLLARFKSYSAAEKSWFYYLRNTGLNQLGGKGDSQRGYAVTRPVGDRAYVLHLGNWVGIWTGADDGAIRKRMTAGGFTIPRRAPLAEVADSATPHPPAAPSHATQASPVSTGLIAGAFVVYLFLVVLYFFKGAAWAGTSRPKPGLAPISATELATRLEAINTLDVPFRLERGAQPNEFFAAWRYADAKWVDLARAHGMRRTIRIQLKLDERNGVVRATDYAADYDWSAGRGGASVEWKAALGIVFFQSEQQRVFGLQLDEQGRFKPELSYAYTFNLNEMKSPLVAAVTGAGWNWRPSVWQGPRWLRWLTE